jgi:hypothetical protein
MIADEPSAACIREDDCSRLDSEGCAADADSISVEHVEQLGHQLVPVLELRECYTLTFCRTSGKRPALRRALSDISPDSESAKVESGKTSDAADRESSLQWKVVAMHPSAHD